MDGQLVAMLDGAADVIDLRKIKPGRNALGVKIERDVDQIHIAGALAIAEQAAFHAVRSGHQA